MESSETPLLGAFVHMLGHSSPTRQNALGATAAIAVRRDSRSANARYGHAHAAEPKTTDRQFHFIDLQKLPETEASFWVKQESS
eukprot:5911741-Pleurochrysis_carterae.AAC.2